MGYKMIEWEKLNNGKWKVKDKVNYNSPDYSRKVRESMKKINPFCEECNTTYNLANPCVHHLSDSPEHRAKYNAYRRKQKEKTITEEEEKSKQTLILNKGGD